MPRPFDHPTTSFSGDKSSHCQASDYVDKYCALVELSNLCVSSDNILFETVLLQVFRKLEEKFSCPSCRARILPLSPEEPAMPCGGSPRSQSKVHPTCVFRALASLSTTALIFLQHGGANLAGRPPSSMAWSRAPRAADSASRISMLSFRGDKRGRMRQSHEAVAVDQNRLWSVSLKSMSSTQLALFDWNKG